MEEILHELEKDGTDWAMSKINVRHDLTNSAADYLQFTSMWLRILLNSTYNKILNI